MTLAEAREKLKAYAATGQGTDGFLRAVLANDLMATLAWMDEDSVSQLRLITQVIIDELPFGCWGSRRAYDDWLMYHRLVTDGEIGQPAYHAALDWLLHWGVDRRPPQEKLGQPGLSA